MQIPTGFDELYREGPVDHPKHRHQHVAGDDGSRVWRDGRRVRPTDGSVGDELPDKADPARPGGLAGETRKAETESDCPARADRRFPVCHRREQQSADLYRDSLLEDEMGSGLNIKQLSSLRLRSLHGLNQIGRMQPIRERGLDFLGGHGAVGQPQAFEVGFPKDPAYSVVMPSERITVDSEVCGGRPCIRGMRVTVSQVLELLAGGMSREQILK